MSDGISGVDGYGYGGAGRKDTWEATEEYQRLEARVKRLEEALAGTQNDGYGGNGEEEAFGGCGGKAADGGWSGAKLVGFLMGVAVAAAAVLVFHIGNRYGLWSAAVHRVKGWWLVAGSREVGRKEDLDVEGQRQRQEVLVAEDEAVGRGVYGELGRAAQKVEREDVVSRRGVAAATVEEGEGIRRRRSPVNVQLDEEGLDGVAVATGSGWAAAGGQQHQAAQGGEVECLAEEVEETVVAVEDGERADKTESLGRLKEDGEAGGRVKVEMGEVRRSGRRRGRARQMEPV